MQVQPSGVSTSSPNFVSSAILMTVHSLIVLAINEDSKYYGAHEQPLVCPLVTALKLDFMQLITTI